MGHCRLLIVWLAVGLASTSHGAELEVQVLGTAAAPGSEFCSRCADGDWLVDNGKFELVIGGSHRRDESFYRFPTADALGSIVFLRPAGTEARGDVMIGTPYVRVNRTTRHVLYDRLEMQESEDRVTFVASGLYSGEHGQRIRFEGRYVIAADAERIDISLSATNVGPTPVSDFIYSLYFDPHQIYDFSPADVAEHRPLAFRGYPRAGLMAAWVDRTPRLANSDYDWGWDGGMILPDPRAVDLEPGGRDSRDYVYFASSEHHRVLGDVYREIEVASQRVSVDFVSESSEYFELVVRDVGSRAIFYRAFLERPAPLTIELPPGSYEAQANFFPGIARCLLTVTRQEAASCRLQDPPQGRATVRIVDSSGASVPGKVSFYGIAPTLSPYLRPQNPALHDGYWESAKNSVFPLQAAMEIELPVGAYRVSASRGPLYSVAEQTVQIEKDAAKSLVFTIDRVLERPDLISMDAHLHTLESDGAVHVAEKIRAIVAEGIDVAIATDHNFPVDYRPELERLGLEDQLIVIAGAEVTVPERLDYNTYPMIVRPGEYNNGAIDALSTDLSGRFEASRERDRRVILQINHPRLWQYDYFNWHGLDPDSAAFANEGFDLSFDVLEVVNGANYDELNNTATRKDWFNLLRRGYFRPLVGTSDSHEIDQDEPGYSRTWIYHGQSAGDPVNIDSLMERVRAGRSFASNGPLLDLVLNGRYGPGETFTATAGAVRVAIDVWSAPWIEAAAVQLYVNGVPQTPTMRAVPHPSAVHWRGELELRLEQDAFVVAELRGSKELSPVVQRRVSPHGEEAGVLPYALTNPVFVDVDGNGTFDPPLSRDIEIRSTNLGQ